jgi:GAF domain/PilZ domain/Sel1 repeat
MQSSGDNLAANRWEPQSTHSERRQCVRQKVHIPAYANLSGKSSGLVLDLSEIVDISERGMCVRTATPLPRNLSLPVVLDLAETKAYLMTMGTVVWSDSAGRAGISFSVLLGESRQQLQEWLFANAIAACVNHAEASPPVVDDGVLARAQQARPFDATSAGDFEAPVRPDYTSILIALAAVKREVDSTGQDFEKALRLIANRARAFTRATGAAIALTEGSGSQAIICRGRAGSDAPPLGTPLDRESGLSGECIRTGKLLRCEDAETDLLVDRESCRQLGIRSMIAVPVRNGHAVVGLLEVFSPQPRAFIANDDMVLQRLAEMIACAIKNANSVPPEKAAPVSEGKSSVNAESTNSGFAKSGFENPGLGNSGLGNSELENSSSVSLEQSSVSSRPAPESADTDTSAGFSTPWFGWVLLLASATTLVVALLWLAAPWLKDRMHAVAPRKPQTASNRAASKVPAQPGAPAVDSDNIQQLAGQGDPVAQFEVGARYATGENVPQDYSQALIWFSKAAEQGNVAAQATLGAYYWAGRGVPQDLSKAYYWAILAEAGGDEGSKYRVALLASRLSRTQILVEQKRAEDWIKTHQLPTKALATPAH